LDASAIEWILSRRDSLIVARHEVPARIEVGKLAVAGISLRPARKQPGTKDDDEEDHGELSIPLMGFN
jgi:hypothetical protein